MKICCMCHEPKDLLSFNKNVSTSDGLNKMCRECGNEHSRQYYAKHKERIKANVKVQRRKLSQKCKLIIAEFRNRGCRICDEDNPHCIDAHHFDPSQKKYSIANTVNRSSPLRLIAELAKCIPLCANCHRKLHSNQLCLVTGLGIEPKTI